MSSTRIVKWKTPSGPAHDLYLDMLKENHLLIAGSTGSGKSVVINALIYTALYKAPCQASFILCDPKMVELSRYAYLPHTIKYADTLAGIASALQQAHKIMMERFQAMKQAAQVETSERHIYVIIDEFADLVCKGPSREENKLRATCEQYVESIGKLGRAAHVHLILATQAPNRKTLKANIVLNMTAKLALRCMSPIESKQIIGIPDAATLPDPQREHRASGYYQHGLVLERWNLPMIPQEDIAARIKWWMDQANANKPKGFLGWLFG